MWEGVTGQSEGVGAKSCRSRAADPCGSQGKQVVRLHFLHGARPEIFPHECVDECMVSMTTLAGFEVDLARVKILVER